MFFLRRFYIVFFAFFASYQYAMNEKLNDDNENNAQNNEEGNYEIPNFVGILESEIKKYDASKIKIEGINIGKIKTKLDEELNYLNNLGNIRENEKYKGLEEYVSGIEERVKKKYEDIDNEFKSLKKNKVFQRLLIKLNRANIVYLSKRKFLKSVQKGTAEYVEELLKPRVMCDDKIFSDRFNKFKGHIDNIINGVKLLKDPRSLEIEEKDYMFSKIVEKDNKKHPLYKFFRNALYRQAYLLFYNTFRVISNVKIEYDLWRSDTGKHIWGVNSSANVYYKYRSSWDYGVFKFNLFYIEFNFGLFHRLLKPLKRIPKFGAVPLYAGGDYFKKTGLNTSDVPFWDMINISLVQISVGPVKINGLRFSLFDPIFLIMTLCFVTYLGFDFENKNNGYGVLNNLNQYCTPLEGKKFYDDIATGDYQGEKKEYWDAVIKDRQNEAKGYWSSLEENYPKGHKIKIILEKIGLLSPGANNTFINKFRLYCKNNILFNIIETWKGPYEHKFYIDIVFHTFARILKSAPEIFKEIPTGGLKPINTIHEKKIIETHYFGSSLYDPSFAGRCGFRGLCDMFFLSIALLVYSMIDSISIDLRWFIENESVRKYCAKIKRKVCSFFK